MTKSMKRIHKVVIKRMVDNDHDTSWLGEYSSSIDSPYTIDRKHDTDCPAQEFNRTNNEGLEQLERVIKALNAHTYGNLDDQECETIQEAQDLLVEKQDELLECNCGAGNLGRNELRYFNPNWQNYKGEPHEDIVKYCLQDYDRMESLQAGSRFFLGISAEATYSLTAHTNVANIGSVIQTITSGGVWGIESDSDKDYLKEIEQEELSELREQLHAIGFSYRAIASAFKNVEHKDGEYENPHAVAQLQTAIDEVLNEDISVKGRQ